MCARSARQPKALSRGGGAKVTLDMVLARIQSSRRAWELKAGSLIRAVPGPGEAYPISPLTSLSLTRLGSPKSTAEWSEAAEDLGLDFDLAHELTMAEDENLASMKRRGWPLRLQVLRVRLLEACRLPSEGEPLESDPGCQK